MTFQRCPICEGKGYVPNQDVLSGKSLEGCWRVKCDTCAGKKIIHCETGRPPGEKPKVTFVGPKAAEIKEDGE